MRSSGCHRATLAPVTVRSAMTVVCLALAMALWGATTTAAAQSGVTLEDLAAQARSARQDPAAQAAFGRALLRAGRYREAHAALSAAARLQRGSQDALFEVAKVAFARGDYRAALAACRPIQRIEEDGVLARVCRARAYLVWNRSARAFEELEAALAADGNHFEALLALGDAHRLRGETAEAEAAYRRAASLRPASTEPLIGLGRLFAAADRRADALRELRRARDLDRRDPEALFELGRALGATAEAKDLLRQAVSLRPGWDAALVALGDAVLRSDPPAAEAAYREAIRLDRQLAAAHVGLGRSLLAQGRHTDAIQSLRRALALVPNDKDSMIALAQVSEATEEYEEAFANYRRAADMDTADPAPLLAAARLAIRLHRDVLAVGFLDRLLGQHAELGPALALYGDAMRARGNRAEATSYYQRALRTRGPLDRRAIQRALAELAADAEPQP